MTAIIKAEPRAGSTKSSRSQLRKAGKVPATVYGKKLSPLSITIDEKELQSLFRGNPNGVVEMEVSGHGNYPVMLGEIQRDTMSRSLLHVDFRQVNMDEPIKTTVPIEMHGDCPGEREGGMLTLLLHELEIRCLPSDVPESIVIDVSALNIGESVSVGDIVPPRGVEIRSDITQILVTVLAPQKDRGEEETQEVADGVALANHEETTHTGQG
jgi:large subunit ribosomal protein L25